MNESTILRAIGAICLTVSYAVAVIRGFDGILFTFYTNAILSILLLSPKAIKRLISQPEVIPSQDLNQ